jgi:hypothetical protein
MTLKMQRILRFIVVCFLATMFFLLTDIMFAQQPKKEATSNQHNTGNQLDTVQSSDGVVIRPFHINFPQADLNDLRKRIAATRWPDKETVADQSQGVQLAKINELARYWATDYDWRKCEAKLNALPQFMTEIDGIDIHFIHVRSKHPNALPLIVTHGWPGSIIEQLPRAHGSSLGRTDEAPRLPALRRPGRRLGCVCRRPDGLAGAYGIACHPHQHACHRSS